jgi:hypothetical protein
MQGSASSCSEGIILTLTETPQYVDKLHAYVRMDIASKRKYWLFGDRRLVLSIAPALN